MRNPLALTMLGGIVCVLLLVAILSRTKDLGVVGIALSIAMAMLWFYLSALLTSPEQSIIANERAAIAGTQKFRASATVSILILGIIFLLLTGILSLLFDSYNAQISKLISMGELSIKTSRASSALQLTFGGILALSFWLPQIIVSSYLMGRRSVALGYWNCLGAVLIGVGLFVAANLVAEIMSGDVSVDRVLNSIFAGGEAGIPRLPAETWFMRFAAIAFGLFLMLALAGGVWQAAKMGYKHSLS